MNVPNKLSFLPLLLFVCASACTPDEVDDDQGNRDMPSLSGDMISDIASDFGQNLSQDMKQDSTVDMMTQDMDREMTSTHSDGCGAPVRSTDETFTLNHQGRTRSFDVHLPRGYDPSKPTALVLGFHGRGSNAAHQAQLSGLNVVADEENFITVHPHGVGDTWNGEVCCSPSTTWQVDDVGFVEAVVEEVSRRFCVDTNKTYALGFSNGSILSHRLGCELDQLFAAIAPVAGPVGSTCEPDRAVAVMHIHGTADTVVPYEGYLTFKSARASVKIWETLNACDETPTQVLSMGDVTCEQWSNCRDNADVQLCTVDRGGHQWPGGESIPGLGYNTDDVNASRLIWSFFKAHPRSP